jgi:hypothetical protein
MANKWMLTSVGGEYFDLDRNGRRLLVSVSEAEAQRYVVSKRRPGDILQKTDKDGYILPWNVRQRPGRKALHNR